MCTYLGRSRELTVSDINMDDLRASRYLYVTGYLWDTEEQKEAVLCAGVRVAFSLSDTFCVDRHKDDFLQLLRRHVDVVVGNRQEAQALTDTETPQQAIRVLAEHSDIAVVTMDSRGSLIQRGETVCEIPPYPVTPVDTTGAGDMFAAGILYGLTRELPLDVTGRIASYAAARVVAKLGPRLEGIDQSAIARLRTGAGREDIRAG
jgi:fructokinase